MDSFRQRVIFAVIIGLALVAISAVLALSPILVYRLGPPDVVATETALAQQERQQALTVTAVALAERETAAAAPSEEAAAETEEAVATVAPTAEAAATATPARRSAAPSDTVESGSITWNGLAVELVDINRDAWPVIEQTNQFNDPPVHGHRMMLIELAITNRDGSEAIAVREADFRMIGDLGRMYTPFDLSCGVIPSSLEDQATVGETISGNVCFQIPIEESGLSLIYRPGVDLPTTAFRLPE